MKRIGFLRALGAMALVPQHLLARAQQAFPSRPVQLTLPYSPGSGPDTLARRISESVATSWGQPLLVNNKPGANGWIATGEVKRAAKDGYSLLMVDTTMMAVHPLLFKDMPFDPDKDFDSVTPLFTTHFFVAVAHDAPWKTIGELIADARKMNGTMAAASFGSMGVTQLGIAALERATQTRMTLVPYKNQSDIYNDVAAGRVAWAWGPAGTIGPLVKAGRLRALAIAAPQRLATYPDVPTVAESGGPAGFQLSTAVAIFAPKGTSEDASRQIHAAVNRAMTDPKVTEYLVTAGAVRWIGSGQDVSAAIRAERARLAEVAAQLRVNETR